MTARQDWRATAGSGSVTPLATSWTVDPMTHPLTSVDPLHRARAAAAHALRDRMLAAGWPTRTATATAELFAEVAIGAWRRPAPGALLHPADVTVITDGDGVVMGYRYHPGGTGR